MSEIFIFKYLTEIFVIAIIPNLFVGRKKVAHGGKRWYTKWDGQYCQALFAFLVWFIWILVEHFILYPLISGLIYDFYLYIGVSNAPLMFILFLIVLYGAFKKEKW